MNNADWNKIYSINTASDAYSYFLGNFLQLYERAFPKNKITIKTKNLLSPWMTKGLLKSSKRKQKLFDKFLKSRTYYNEQSYKHYKTLFENTKLRSKSSYYAELISKYTNNIKNT